MDGDGGQPALAHAGSLPDALIVAPRHGAEMPVKLRDGVEIVYWEPDLSDLADRCAEYVHDEPRRRPIEAAAARYFDDHLHPVRLAERYLRVVRELDRLAPERAAG